MEKYGKTTSAESYRSPEIEWWECCAERGFTISDEDIDPMVEDEWEDL